MFSLLTHIFDVDRYLFLEGLTHIPIFLSLCDLYEYAMYVFVCVESFFWEVCWCSLLLYAHESLLHFSLIFLKNA